MERDVSKNKTEYPEGAAANMERPGKGDQERDSVKDGDNRTAEIADINFIPAEAGRSRVRSRRKKTLADFIVDNNKLIRNITLVIVVISGFFALFVNINYDLTEYLPDTQPSKVAINKMEETFGYPGTGRLMLSDVTIYEAKQFKDEIEELRGVDQVVWCDTSTQIYASSEFIDYDDITDYYQDGCAVMDITFAGSDTSAFTYSTIDEIEELVGNRGYLAGPAANNKFSEENIKLEMNKILVMVIIFITVILLFTTTSWFEPVLFLTVLGCAVVLSKGTNAFLGTISHITNNVCIVLQLAVSMDYSIFLLHSYERERSEGLDKTEAMKKGLDATITTILASSLTTFFGFVVLVFMQFALGLDLGLVMAKSIICSLVMIIFLMPSLLLSWSDLIDKYRHRSFLPSMDKFSVFVRRAGPVILVLSILMAIPVYTAKNMNDFKYGVEATGAGPGTEIYEAREAINGKFGRSNLLIALIPDTDSIKEKALTEELEDKEYVRKVMGLSGYLPDGVPESILPGSVTELFHKDGYARLLIYIATMEESQAAFRYTEEVTAIVESYYPDECYITGNTPVTIDMQNTMGPDYTRVNTLAMITIFIIVAISFRSLLLGAAAMVPIEMAIWTNMSLPYFTGNEMIFLSYLVVSCVQLGATIDYAISEISNYLQIRKTEPDKRRAAELLTSMSFPSILTSGCILISCGYSISFLSSIPAINTVGMLVGQGTIFSVFYVTMIMPALLQLIDRSITVSWKVRMREDRARRRNIREGRAKRAQLMRKRTAEKTRGTEGGVMEA